ncbi:rhodanese-related sulfurtransferase [Buchnera aphidicola (Aphis helianthi)]|uniref:tRNA uridine(34) hydroxylase n=1 Tax=Buchnera aphidicola (Aphis helianthi) TaxID=2315802 RepID=A0A4D6XK85_9GAMM|nr:rhodanese-related sulfurtransferase [Buchnera aphidicola]QCI17182.1 rhodanese-related sulfurtransferase [Buchnera aphidicola (Aphis helianthi)]
MSILHNYISKKELKRNMFLKNESRLILSFYKYFCITELKKFRDEIYKKFFQYNILGRVYISNEGINAQISIPIHNYTIFKKFLYQFHPVLNNLRINKTFNINNANAFWLLSVKIKKYIVNDGIKNPLFKFENVGLYIKAEKVNLMLNDKKTIFIDMRNSYEYAIGHFPNAIEIKSKTFREQLKNVIKVMNYAKDKNIVMYCTGGIRCEKATSWMIFNGFKHIYHIEGGIIGYINEAKKKRLPIHFQGSNFVFDNRMSEKISEDIISVCKQCNQPSDNYVNCIFNLCHLLFIQCHNCAVSFKNCCSSECMKHI